MAYFSSSLKKCLWGTSLAVQWLRLPAYDARATRSIPGRGTEITCVTQPKQVFSSTENNLIFYFLNNCRIVFHSGCIILYSHKECTRVPTSLSPCQHIVSPFFFFFFKEGLPWWSSDWDSELPMQGAWVRSLVGKQDPTCCLLNVTAKTHHRQTDKCKKKKKVVVFMYISSINFYRSILISGPCRVWNKIYTIICCISHDTIQWKMLTGDQIHVRWTWKRWGPLEPDTLRQIFPATSWLCNWTSCFSIVLYLPHLWNGYPHCSRMLWGLSEDPRQVWHSAWFAAILRKR